MFAKLTPDNHMILPDEALEAFEGVKQFTVSRSPNRILLTPVPVGHTPSLNGSQPLVCNEDDDDPDDGLAGRISSLVVRDQFRESNYTLADLEADEAWGRNAP